MWHAYAYVSKTNTLTHLPAPDASHQLTRHNRPPSSCNAANIICVVGVVIANKYITEVDGFNYVVFLSFLHFTVTSIGTRVLLGVGSFQFKAASLNNVLVVAVGSLLSVAFMNLNLSHNRCVCTVCTVCTLCVSYVLCPMSGVLRAVYPSLFLIPPPLLLLHTQRGVLPAFQISLYTRHLAHTACGVL